MSKVRDSAYPKKQRGRYVWGVLRLEGRKQNFRTVGEGDSARQKAEKLAAKLDRMEVGSKERFLSWHSSGEPLPLDRTVRHYAHCHAATVAPSTARRNRQLAERLASQLGSRDLRHLREEDIGDFIAAERADGRAKDPTINACVLLRSTVLAALRAKNPDSRPHLTEDPLPNVSRIARRTARKLWPPKLDDDPSTDAWTLDEVRSLLDTAARHYPDLYGVCLFQLSTGCRIGEALGMRWSAVNFDRGEVTIRLKIHTNTVGPPKTAASNRTNKIPQRLIEFLKVQKERQRTTDGWVFPSRRKVGKHWDDRKYQEAWRKLRRDASVRALGTHAWRHTFISNALSSEGWTPAEVAEHVGSSIKMILERYTHVIRRNRRVDFSFLDDLES